MTSVHSHDGVINSTPPPGSSAVTPARILSAVAVLLILFVILTPQDHDDTGAMYSSYAAGAGGARALYETLGRLGFAVSRNQKSLVTPPDTTSTYVLLEPAQPLTAIEQSHLLRSVRRGATLVFTPSDAELADSLGFEAAASGGFYTLSATMVAGGNPPSAESRDPRAAFQSAFPIATTVAAKPGSDGQAFLWLTRKRDIQDAQFDSTTQPTLVVGHRVGQGYAVAVAPPTILMNQVIRNPRAAIAVVRAIQFANSIRAGGSRSNRVVFDEYHHGFGAHADMTAAVEHALVATPIGRVTIALVAAALVFLLALAVRPIAPLPVPPISRRSPLEHVGALAHAYSQINARALGASRLLRGLRRRHSLGLARSVSDSAYLSALRTRIPAASTDIDRMSNALTPNSPDSSDHFAAIGAAIANIERILTE